MRSGQCVQCAKWLIHQQHLGLHRQCPCNTHPLFHSAGNLIRPLVHSVGHVHPLEIKFDPVVDLSLALGRAKDLLYSQFHVLVSRQPWQQGVVLENDRPLRPRLIDFASI